MAGRWYRPAEIARAFSLMSATTSAADTDRGTRTFECEGPDCDEEFEEADAIESEYCSFDCSNRDDGRNLLWNIKHDHRFCFGCFKQLKEVSRPPKRYPDFVVGYQYLTPAAEHGEIEGRAHIEGPNDELRRRVEQGDRAPSPADSLVMTGSMCECGTTDHRDAWMRETAATSISDAARRLCEILAFQAREGQHDKTVRAETLVATLTETVREEGHLDWALAVGRATES